ncbi:hypothetical protein Tco_0432083 [Tanacetum coccineum]
MAFLPAALVGNTGTALPTIAMIVILIYMWVNCWLYRCVPCGYDAHVSCATSKKQVVAETSRSVAVPPDRGLILQQGLAGAGGGAINPFLQGMMGGGGGGGLMGGGGGGHPILQGLMGGGDMGQGVGGLDLSSALGGIGDIGGLMGGLGGFGL